MGQHAPRGVEGLVERYCCRVETFKCTCGRRPICRVLFNLLAANQMAEEGEASANQIVSFLSSTLTLLDVLVFWGVFSPKLPRIKSNAHLFFNNIDWF